MNNKNPLVSIIIPNYNNARYLRECIISCTNQTYENIEILIIDDCSTDDSIKIIRFLADIDSRIKLIQNPINLKVSKTRDIGIKKAKGDWIMTLDSDDVLANKLKIEKEVSILKRIGFKENFIVFSNIVYIDDEGRPKKIYNKNSGIQEGNLLEGIITRSCFIPRDFLFNKKLYFEVGGFDFNLPIYEDWDLKIKLATRGVYFYSGIDGIGYRIHGLGLSSIKKEERLYWKDKIFNKYIDDLSNKDELIRRYQNSRNESVLKKFFKIIYSRLFK